MPLPFPFSLSIFACFFVLDFLIEATEDRTLKSVKHTEPDAVAALMQAFEARGLHGTGAGVEEAAVGGGGDGVDVRPGRRRAVRSARTPHENLRVVCQNDDHSASDQRWGAARVDAERSEGPMDRGQPRQPDR